MDPVQIGVKELYDLLKDIDGKLDSQLLNHALLEQRVTNMERRESKTSDRRWMVVAALITAFLALISAFITPLIVR